MPIMMGSTPKALTGGKEKMKPMKPMTGKKGPKVGSKKPGMKGSSLNKLSKLCKGK